MADMKEINKEREKIMEVINNDYVLLPKLARISGNTFVKIAKPLYWKLGIQVIGDYDGLFYMVKLPDGWYLKRAEIDGISLLVDDTGDIRGAISYEYKDLNRVKHATFNGDVKKLKGEKR